MNTSHNMEYQPQLPQPQTLEKPTIPTETTAWERQQNKRKMAAWVFDLVMEEER